MYMIILHIILYVITIYFTEIFSLYMPIYLKNIQTFYMLMVSLLIYSFSSFEHLELLNKSTQSTILFNFYPILELAQFLIFIFILPYLNWLIKIKEILKQIIFVNLTFFHIINNHISI